MTTLTDMTARNPLKSVRECGFNCVEPGPEEYLLRNVITRMQENNMRRQVVNDKKQKVQDQN